MRSFVGLTAFVAVAAATALPQTDTSSTTVSTTDYLSVKADTGAAACKILGAWFEEAWDGRTPMNPYVAQKCLYSMPFNRQEASSLLTEMRYAASSLSLVPHVAKSPLPALEMPKFNINDTFAVMEDAVTAPINGYKDMFSFYMDVYRAFGRMQDGHTLMLPKCAALVEYYHDYPIMSLSDEVWTVKIERTDENANGNVDIRLDKQIKTINGVDVIDYLLGLSSAEGLAVQLQDPDARWNNLMAKYPTISFQEKDPRPQNHGTFAYRKEWDPELDEMELEFADGEKVKVEWKATSAMDVRDITEETGGYTFSTPKELLESVCMKPISTLSKRSDEEAEEEKGGRLTRRAWIKYDDSDIVGYPDPPSRGPEDLAMVFADETDPSNTTAILRLSSFAYNTEQYTDQQYYDYIAATLPELKSRGVKKLIIDVTNNGGGMPNYAKVIRQTIFSSSPDIHTPGRIRWNQVIDDAIAGLTPLEFKEEEFRTPDGKYFSSAREFLGPYHAHDAYWLSLASLDYETEPLETITLPKTDLWSADDVVILADGQCHSTCHIFVEGLTHRDVGVRAYALGGRPGDGPMQPVGGTKGGTNRSLKELDDMLVQTGRNAFMYRTYFQTGMVNIEDQYRDNDDDDKVLPLQYRFTPACARIRHTKQTLEDVRYVWGAVREIAWDKDGAATECEHLPEPDGKSKVAEGDVEQGEGVEEGVEEGEGELKGIKVGKGKGDKVDVGGEEEEESKEEGEGTEEGEAKEDEEALDKVTGWVDDVKNVLVGPSAQMSEAIWKAIRHN